MHTCKRICVALLACLPAALIAKGVEIPEIGMKLADVPDKASVGRAPERPDHWTAAIDVGPATLELRRFDQAVQQKEPDQAALTSQYRGRGDRISAVSQAVIGGQNAWVISGMRQTGRWQFGSSTPISFVDEHSVHLSAKTFGAGQRPPEFDEAVLLMNSIAFVPVRRAIQPPPSASTSTSLPRFVSAGDSVYPEAALRRRKQGIVDVTFNIDEQGQVRNLKELFSDHPDLGKDIPAFLQNGRFRVPDDWLPPC